MSEAECIRDHLVAGGINADRILLEDRSTSTEENMRYSLPLLRSLETDVESVGIVTNDFSRFPRAVSGAEKRRIHVLRRPGPLHRVRLHPLRDARIFSR